MYNGIVLFCCLIVLSGTAAHGLTGGEILAKMDMNRDYSTFSSNAVMTIHIDDEQRVKTMKIMGASKGNKAVVEFTNPEDLGTKYLMLNENLWIYFPDEDDVVKISGHLLKEGMMGSDVSYEDALESGRLADKYTIALRGEEVILGKTCYTIALDAKTKQAPYDKRIMWVEKETFVALKEELYAKSGKLLKVVQVLETGKIGGRTVPVKSETINALRKNSKTVFEVNSIEFDVPLKDEVFSMRWLRR